MVQITPGRDRLAGGAGASQVDHRSAGRRSTLDGRGGPAADDPRHPSPVIVVGRSGGWV